MTLPLVDAADVLRAAGLTVIEHDGWKTRNRTDGGFAPRALIIHHDASPIGDSPSIPAYMIDPAHNGAQFWVDRAGVWHCLAAGRMWHAGVGTGWGVIRANQGNYDSAGVETDHTIGEDWPTAQLSSLKRGTAALCRRYGWNPLNAVCGHKEYAPGRKPDPDGIEMGGFRADVAAGPQEEDMQLGELVNYRVPQPDGAYRSLYDSAWQARADAMTIQQTQAAHTAALAAIAKDEDVTPDTLAAEIDRAVAKHTPTAAENAEAQRPFLVDVVRDALGEDNAAQADAIVEALVRRLAGGA